MPLERKAIISREGHCERTEGKLVKLLLDKKRMRRCGREVPKLEGRELRPVLERSRCVKVAPRVRISRGKEGRGTVSFRVVGEGLEEGRVSRSWAIFVVEGGC